MLLFIWYAYTVIYWCNERFVMICLLGSYFLTLFLIVILVFKNQWNFHWLRLKSHTCQGRPGYFGEPEWISMQLPEISRVTWQIWNLIFYRIPSIEIRRSHEFMRIPIQNDRDYLCSHEYDHFGNHEFVDVHRKARVSLYKPGFSNSNHGIFLIWMITSGIWNSNSSK